MDELKWAIENGIEIDLVWLGTGYVQAFWKVDNVRHVTVISVDKAKELGLF